VIIMNVLICGK